MPTFVISCAIDEEVNEAAILYCFVRLEPPSGDSGFGKTGKPENHGQMPKDRPGETRGGGGARVPMPSRLFMGIGVGRDLPHRPAPKTCFISRQKPILGKLSLEARILFVAMRLRTIHPNLGPKSRDKTERGKARRLEKRYGKRREKREARENVQRQEEEKQQE